MECNKDEAIRAKQLAERKMESNDFEGARKIALKAQNLHPELENISQLLSVCDVHCSAKSRIYGSEKDWYGILQVERLASEVIIKKQYRRLALFLHPDKNRFPGAEAAFKLICEANAVLTDTTKKSIYDSKIRATGGSTSVNLPPYHMNRNSQFHKQYGSHNSVYTHSSSLHQHQTAEPIFWTRCPFCRINYQYQRRYVNTVLHCQRCSKAFTGYETSTPFPMGGSTRVPPVAEQVTGKPTVGQTSGFQERAVPGQSKFTTGIHNVKGSSSNFEPVQTKPSVRTERVFEGAQVASQNRKDLKSKGASNNVSLHGGKCNTDANCCKRDKLNKKSRKRGRKHTVESSASSDTSSDSDVAINPNSGSRSGPVHYPRRSTRRRQNVSYHEGGDDDDDDILHHFNGSQGSKLSENNGKEENFSEDKDSEDGNENCKETGTVHPEENVQDRDANCDEDVKKREERGGMSDVDTDPIEIESDSEQDSVLNGVPAGDICDCPDPEFNDFDKNRAECCFAVNQFWACYDTIDSMPRFYAKVKEVSFSPFEVSFTWLEAAPIDEALKKWRDAGLPIGCGTFKLGETEKTSMLPTFSHQMHCNPGKKRGSFIIYPRQGEVWAVFKDWDLSWSAGPEKHGKYKYEIVEVLSNFDAACGIKVRYLDKVAEFVSLFERSRQSEISSFLVGPDEIYKFSHRIPCYTMTGTERQGVPVGSYELDPASLPLEADDLHYPSRGKIEA